MCFQTAIGCADSDPNCELPEPVCEQKTFANECEARCAGAVVVHAGTCEDPAPECASDADCGPGFYCEFCTPGELDVVIYDDGVEV